MIETRPYTFRPAAFRPYDFRFPEVAELVISALRSAMGSDNGLEIEHIGSTAVPGCGGKGNIDLILTYAPDHLTSSTVLLNDHGIPRWDHVSAHPASRPVHIADVAYDNTWWPVHIHVIERSDPEVRELRRFRNLLRSDPVIVARYEADKRAIIARGITFGPAYAERKAAFIRRTLEEPHG